MVENNWIRSTCCQLPNTSLSESFDIDYVRVWQAEYDSSVGMEPAPAFTPDYEGFKMWPNPSEGLLYVNRSIPSINIHDVDGKILAVLPVKERQVNWKQALPDLRGGMYPVSTGDGQVIKRMMLIK